MFICACRGNYWKFCFRYNAPYCLIAWITSRMLYVGMVAYNHHSFKVIGSLFRSGIFWKKICTCTRSYFEIKLKTKKGIAHTYSHIILICWVSCSLISLKTHVFLSSFLSIRQNDVIKWKRTHTHILSNRIQKQKRKIRGSSIMEFNTAWMLLLIFGGTSFEKNRLLCLVCSLYLIEQN